MKIEEIKKIERKWQKIWEKAKVFEANVEEKPKFFLTFPYPYVQGGPHLGHIFSFGRADVYARFKRMQGFNVLFPQGFHATGEPILGAIKRLKENDPDQIYAFKIYGVTDEDLEKFKQKGPKYLAKFWMKRWIKDLKKFGASVDWRRTFITALTPQYNRFIEWQYKKLKKLGYVVKGTHPVVWCPKCKSPTGDHDRLIGEGESPIEFTILKFKFEDKIIPCATLRPETIFGVTNLWINPEKDYFWTKVKENGKEEVWLLTEKAIEKLNDQLKQAEKLEKANLKEIIGKKVFNPVLENEVLILPARFVDPNFGTGVVMSVPAHAPWDWIALEEIKKDEKLLKEFGIEVEKVKEIQPISIIKIEGFGEFPAKEIVESHGIKSSQEKEKLDKVTQIIYSKEYYQGILKENCKEYANQKISEIKEKLIEDFKSKNIASQMWELTGKVVCRCKTENHVKILKDQWFLKFSDENWKAKVKQCIAKMKFYPEEIRKQFLNTVDWLKDKACARKSGLGTKLPWDREWIIETLSDSVIYMAFYTIARIIREKKIKAKNLRDEVFDYVFLGQGDLEAVASKSGLKKEVLEEMRREFEYFYPLDIRISAKDLVQNHLTFFLFHHVAIWPEKYWPRSIAVNGYVSVEGKKMSKRFGNVLVLKDLIEKYGSDLVRMTIVSAAENLEDANWEETYLNSIKERIDFIFELIKQLKKMKREEILNQDRFLEAELEKVKKEVKEDYENLRFRSVAQKAFFYFYNVLKWYLSRCIRIENCNGKMVKEVLKEWLKVLHPLLPHLTQEAWYRLGEKNLLVFERWAEKPIDEKSIEKEEFLKELLEDFKVVKKLVERVNEVTLIVASKQKFEIQKRLKTNPREVFEEFKNDAQMMEYLKKMLKFKDKKFLEREEQLRILNEAKEFLEKVFNAKVKVEVEEESKVEKAKQANPFKVAIFIA